MEDFMGTALLNNFAVIFRNRGISWEAGWTETPHLAKMFKSQASDFYQ